MSQDASIESVSAPNAIDVYDERVRRLIEVWKAEMADVTSREREELARWRREQRK